MIKAHVTDATALIARSPAELATYLRANGWRLASRTDLVASWALGEGGAELEIMQPLDQGLRDYALRMSDALVVLASVEKRSELEILQQISGTTWDILTARLTGHDETPGWIAIDDAVVVHESMRGLLSAAAYSVLATHQRGVQPSRKPQDLVDFLRGVRIGPAVEGSYILAAHIPVPPSLSDQLTGEDDPLGRRVSLRMYHAAHAAQRAADRALLHDNGLQGFTESVVDGVSANLCESLAGLSGDGRPFELSFALAPVRPGSGMLPTVRFRRDHVPVLREAAAELRARMPEEDVTVVGEVVRLHREGHGSGEITMVGRVDDSEVLRRIWTDLPGAEYEAAMRAHAEMRQVIVRGSLARRGTRFHLASASGFRLLDESS